MAADEHWKTKFPEGTMKVADKDGNGTIDASDRYVLGHCDPTWTGSLTSTLTYKNLDFSFSLYTSQGGYVYSPFMREFARYGSRGTQHIKLDYYIPEGAPILADDGTVTTQTATHYARRRTLLDRGRERTGILRGQLLREGEEHHTGIHIPEELDAENQRVEPQGLCEHPEPVHIHRLQGIRPGMG